MEQWLRCHCDEEVKGVGYIISVIISVPGPIFPAVKRPGNYVVIVDSTL